MFKRTFTVALLFVLAFLLIQTTTPTLVAAGDKPVLATSSGSIFHQFVQNVRSLFEEPSPNVGSKDSTDAADSTDHIDEVDAFDSTVGGDGPDSTDAADSTVGKDGRDGDTDAADAPDGLDTPDGADGPDSVDAADSTDGDDEYSTIISLLWTIIMLLIALLARYSI